MEKIAMPDFAAVSAGKGGKASKPPVFGAVDSSGKSAVQMPGRKGAHASDRTSIAADAAVPAFPKEAVGPAIADPAAAGSAVASPAAVDPAITSPAIAGPTAAPPVAADPAIATPVAAGSAAQVDKTKPMAPIPQAKASRSYAGEPPRPASRFRLFQRRRDASSSAGDEAKKHAVVKLAAKKLAEQKEEGVSENASARAFAESSKVATPASAPASAPAATPASAPESASAATPASASASKPSSKVSAPSSSFAARGVSAEAPSKSVDVAAAAHQAHGSASRAPSLGGIDAIFEEIEAYEPRVSVSGGQRQGNLFARLKSMLSDARAEHDVRRIVTSSYRIHDAAEDLRASSWIEVARIGRWMSSSGSEELAEAGGRLVLLAAANFRAGMGLVTVVAQEHASDRREKADGASAGVPGSAPVQASKTKRPAEGSETEGPAKPAMSNLLSDRVRAEPPRASESLDVESEGDAQNTASVEGGASVRDGASTRSDAGDRNVADGADAQHVAGAKVAERVKDAKGSENPESSEGPENSGSPGSSESPENPDSSAAFDAASEPPASKSASQASPGSAEGAASAMAQAQAQAQAQTQTHASASTTPTTPSEAAAPASAKASEPPLREASPSWSVGRTVDFMAVAETLGVTALFGSGEDQADAYDLEPDWLRSARL